MSRQQDFHVGRDFFKRLCEANTKNTIVPELPGVNEGEMMTKTQILKTVIPKTEVSAEFFLTVMEDNFKMHQ